jgi:thiol:disulfide interchange protein
MKFEHRDYAQRYRGVSKFQKSRLLIYGVALAAIVVAMFQLRQCSAPPTPPKAGPIEWVLTFEEARARAKLDSKPIMAFFFVEGNEACRRMESEIFTADVVRAQAQKFICVRLDGAAHPELVKRYRAIVYPAVAFTTPRGEWLRTVPYPQSPEHLVDEMREALKPQDLIPVSLEPSAGGDEADDEPGPEQPEESPALPPRPAEPSRGDAE